MGPLKVNYVYILGVDFVLLKSSLQFGFWFLLLCKNGMNSKRANQDYGQIVGELWAKMGEKWAE